MRIKGIKTLSAILAVIMLFGSFTAFAADREVVASGTSVNLTWTLYSDGEMHIGGSGNLTSGFTAHYTKIKKLTIGKDVTCSDSYDFDGNYTGFMNLETIVVEEGNKSFATDENGVLFNKNKTKIYLFPAASSLAEYDIPDSVTTICSIAFGNAQNLKKVTGGKNVSVVDSKAFYCSTGIEQVLLTSNKLSNFNGSAFYKCSSLEKVTVSGGNAIAGSRAFEYCSNLECVEFQNGGISYISTYAFSECTKLKKIALTDNIDEICSYAFSGCTSIESLDLPDSITTIGYGIFKNCTSLKSSRIPRGVTRVEDIFRGCTALEEVTLHRNIWHIASDAFKYCNNLKSVYYLGSIEDWCQLSINNIYANPLQYGADLYIDGKIVYDVTFPEGTTEIGRALFYGYKNLKSVTLPKSVKKVNKNAFDGCTSLNTINIIGELEYIGERAFSYTGFYKDAANWDNGFLYLGTSLIAADKNKIPADCTLYSKTKLIADRVFYNFDNLKSITMPNSVKYINNEAFYGCDALEQVYISDSIEKIGEAAFCGCKKLTDIKLGSNLTEIGEKTFLSCTSLKEVNIPENVKVIKSNAFSNCTSLEKATLNKGLTAIEVDAFEGDSNLTKLDIPGTVTSIDPTAFDNSGITDIYYGSNKAQWKRATGGESFDGITVHYTLKSDDETVIIQHTDDNFTWEAGNVHLKVEDLTNVTTSYEQNGFYNRLLAEPIQVLDIKLVDGDNNPIQPLSDEKITVKIKASDEFMSMLKTAFSSVSEHDIAADKIDFVNDSFVFEVDGKTVTVSAAEKFLKSFKVIHWKSDAVLPTDHESFTHDMLEVKDGYIILQTNHFSEYAVCTDILKFEQTELEIENGKTAQLKVTVGDDETVTYTSSDENVAKVDSNGAVTAVGPGTATITASVSGTGVKAECTVTVPFRTFTVKWVVDGVVTEQEITEQSPLTAPVQTPEKDGYIFKGWSPEIPNTMPAKNLTFTAVFEPIQAEKIEIITAPTKTSYIYKLGSIDLSGIEILVTYSDGSTETVTDTSEMTVSGFNSAKTGNQIVTVEYNGATDNFNVSVSYTWWQWLIRIIFLGIFWY